jgi:hypothetical protein
MLSDIEQFCREHGYTIQALTALGTLLAVFASVLIAWTSARSNRTQLRASAAIFRVIQEGLPQDQAPKYLTVTVTNTGALPLFLEFAFFNWKVPFSGGFYTVSPLEAFPQGVVILNIAAPPPTRFPFELKPRSSRMFRLSDLATFEASRNEMLGRPRLLRWLRARFTWPVVVSADGRIFRAEVSQQIRRALLAAV